MKAATKHTMYRFLMTVALAGALCTPALAEPDGPGYSFGDTTGKNEACLTCHADGQKVKGPSLINPAQFGHTTHAKIGCPSCHEGVAPTHPTDGVRTPRANCQQCHGEVNSEYASSIHAGKTSCSGCHNPHKVESPREISGMEINQMCGGCHDKFKMSAKHGEWLPQADLHLYMLPCITCHTGSKNYFISMYVVSTKNQGNLGKPEVASYQELKELTGGRDILTLIDSNHDNYISISELRNFNLDRDHKSLRLQGMLTPETVSHRFEILDDRRNCTFCHGSGPTVMQTSYLSIPEVNGTYRRVQVEKGAVLDALYGTPDFYLMGSNKNNMLSWIGLAVVCGGLIMPVCHGFLRFLTRKNRTRKEH
ncbi:cytochrome c [Geomonas limicola]|uniref:Cytochrome c n=1 Tax=Geomonas limicola TaxID=2740186 RepID=A0A6V8N9G3_9BACT|nr:cytochrome c3 family protein [Geomonas limicola]GFO68437.1 cytochrome c [Geomonas limicola]